MSKTRTQKQEELQVLVEALKNNGTVFVRNNGANALQSSTLSSNLYKANCAKKTAKKTLIKLAAKSLDLPEPTDDLMQGAVFVVYSKENDPLSAASVLHNFLKQKENQDKLSIIGGYFNNEIMDSQKAVKLGSIPPREVLLAKMLMCMKSPITGFVGSSNQIISGFVRVLKAYADQKQ